MNRTRPVSQPVLFQACGTRGKNAQVPGPPTLISSPILKVISPEAPGDLVAVAVQMEHALGAELLIARKRVLHPCLRLFGRARPALGIQMLRDFRVCVE